MNYEHLKLADPELYASMERELGRQRDHLELIASENFTSPAVMEAVGSHLTNKYAEGYPGARYYGGCDYVDEVERLAIDRVTRLFGADHANVQPHSGSQANMAVYAALLQPGDRILGMNLSHGGHLTHGAKVNLSGKIYNSFSYGVNPETGRIDFNEVEDVIRAHQPKLVVAGASAYPRIIDFARLREIADRAGCLLMVDMAHIAGLVAAGLHPSPIPYAHVVTTTTHKTLRGPRGGMILCGTEEYAKKLNSAIFPGTQGGPLMHVIAAKAVALKEALSDDFKDYQKQILVNAQALAAGLMKRGITIVSGGTDNHLMLVDLQNLGLTGKQAEKMLDEVHITCNKNTIPNDPKSPFVTSGVGLGTPAVTSRGLNTDDMDQIAEAIAMMIKEGEPAADKAKAIVKSLTEKYPLK